ncbi:helix-turn-helix domain-containing protein [Streptomyces sp. NBC_01016]|uniref:helix-turn-helix domain-containing protein n=1 Tax=Streptomyces sp. NBC_01016 TaxID=2903720 RepID=UPI00225100C4|nr:helix-turn-helix domain-containing protein [Streptomyces sp. NBC_01016]MCX4835273.1 helix-turn-helix domain-containing protein [Streptomyces sp. NBC_01016]
MSHPLDLEAVLRLVDELAESDADLGVLLERTAGALGRAVGIRTVQGEVRTAVPDGRPAGDPEQAVPGRVVTRELPGTGQIWIDTAGLPLTEAETTLLLRRLGIGAKVALLGRVPAARPVADGVALRSVVDGGVDASERARTWLRLGFGEASVVMVFALAGPPGVAGAFVDGLRGLTPVVLHAPVGAVQLVVAKELDPGDVPGVPVGARAAFAGPCPAADAPQAWQLARTALRFARPSTRARGPYGVEEATLVDAARLGGYALLAETLSAEQIAPVPDVRQLGRLVDDHGDDMLVCLEAVAATDSVRKAARLLHRHHNSVAYRVERAQRYLGFSFTEPYGRTRLFLALVLRRLQESGDLYRADPTAGGTDGSSTEPPAQ